MLFERGRKPQPTSSSAVESEHRGSSQSVGPSVRRRSTSVACSTSDSSAVEFSQGDDVTSTPPQPNGLPSIPQDVTATWSSASGLMGAEEQSMTPMSEELPPSYASLRTISNRTVFTFSKSANNTMLLLPPPDASDPLPVFNVSVSLNCFNPGSFITTVRRGSAVDDDAIVGEFEMGVSRADATVTIGQDQKKLDKVVVFSSRWRSAGSLGVFSWRFLGPEPRQQLVWNQEDPSRFSCRQGSVARPIGDTVAVFETHLLEAPADGRRRRPQTLTVWPRAYNDPTMLTHVMLSALVIERRRLTPSSDAVNVR